MDSQRKAMSVFLYWRVGEKEEASRRFQELLTEAENATLSAGQLAWAYAGMGDVDKFFEWLIKSAEDRSMLPSWLRNYPLFEDIRSDPRYVEFLAKWKLKP